MVKKTILIFVLAAALLFSSGIFSETPALAQLTPTPTDIDASSRAEIHERSVERAWQREGRLILRYGGWFFVALVLLFTHLLIWRRKKLKVFAQHPSIPIALLALLTLLVLLTGYLLMGRYRRYSRQLSALTRSIITPTPVRGRLILFQNLKEICW